MAAGGNAETELDTAFDIIQSDLGEDWLHLALKLRLKHNVIEEILKQREENLMWRSRSVLEKWRHLNGKKATLEKLLETLERTGRQDLVDRVKDKLHPGLQDDKEKKKVKKKTVKKARKRKHHKRKGHSSDLKFVKCSVKSMQHAKGKKCCYVMIETSLGDKVDDNSVDLCQEIIGKLCEGFKIGDTWSSSICVQMFPKSDERMSELNKYLESGKLAADLQTGFEKVGLNCPLEVDVLSTEQLKEEVAEIVEEAMNVFVLSETSEHTNETDGKSEESAQTYEELRDTWRDALLRITAWTGDEDKVKTLLQAGVQVNTENSEGETPLWDAVKGGHANIVRLLLQKGANPASANMAGANTAGANPAGANPAGADTAGENMAGADTAGADMAGANTGGLGKMPLWIAAQSGNAEIVSILTQAGAKLEEPDHEGRTPLYMAAESGHTEVVCILAQAGADLNKADGMGWTPLSVAALSGHAEIVSILAQAGADLNKADDKGRTLLWMAAEWGHEEIVSILAQAGADLNKADNVGRTSLYMAAKLGHADIVSILIQAGADLNKADFEQKTPLWVAAHHGFMEVVKVLIEAGADVSEPDNTGKTPYQAAIEMNHNDVAKVIQEGQAKKTLKKK